MSAGSCCPDARFIACLRALAGPRPGARRALRAERGAVGIRYAMLRARKAPAAAPANMPSATPLWRASARWRGGEPTTLAFGPLGWRPTAPASWRLPQRVGAAVARLAQGSVVGCVRRERGLAQARRLAVKRSTFRDARSVDEPRERSALALAPGRRRWFVSAGDLAALQCEPTAWCCRPPHRGRGGRGR